MSTNPKKAKKLVQTLNKIGRIAGAIVSVFQKSPIKVGPKLGKVITAVAAGSGLLVGTTEVILEPATQPAPVEISTPAAVSDTLNLVSIHE